MQICKRKVFYLSISLILIGLLGLGGIVFFNANKSSSDDFITVKPLKQDKQEIGGNQENIAQQDSIKNEIREDSINLTDDISKQEEIKIPKKFINDAPFIPQAPYKNWDFTHEEACEEASLIVAHFYLKNQKKVSVEEAEQEIQNLVDYKIKNYGGHRDLNVEQMVRLAKDYYKENYEIINEYNLDQLKLYLGQGKIIIIPAAGRLLNNPNFKTPGPLYHALVLIGYDEDKKLFITQDPGTRKGEHFKYNYDIILNAIHDFPGDKEKILEGRKAVILVSKS